MEEDFDDEVIRGILAASDSLAIDDDTWFMKKDLDIDATCQQLNDALIKKRDWNTLRSSMARFANVKDMTELKQQISLTLDDGSKDPWGYDDNDDNNGVQEFLSAASRGNVGLLDQSCMDRVMSVIVHNKLKSAKPGTSPSFRRKSPSPPRTSPSSQQLPPLFSPIKSQDGYDELLAWPLRVKHFLDDENVELYMRSRGTNRINTAPSTSLATRFNKLNYIGVAADSNVPLSQKQHDDMKNIYSMVEPRFIVGQRPASSTFTAESKMPAPDPLIHLTTMSQNFKEAVDEEYNSGVKALQTNLGMFPEWSNRFTSERLLREHKIKQFKGHMDDYNQGMILQSFSVANKFNVLKDNKWQNANAIINIQGYRDGVEHHRKLRQEKLLKCRHPQCNKLFAYPDDVVRHELSTHYSDDLHFQRSFLKKIALPNDWKIKRKLRTSANADAARRR